MCRGQKHCADLGDADELSRASPLPPPAWLVAEVRRLSAAAERAASGDIDGALEMVRSLESARAREWFVEHAQISANHRLRVRGTQRRGVQSVTRARVRTAESLRRWVWERDGYTCQYCGIPTIHEDARRALQRALGEDVLPWGDTNAARHGVALAARTEYDHVVPLSQGGADDASNLVAACACCNYGKDRYTIEELGLDDPRMRPVREPGWDGLRSVTKGLGAAPTLLRS